MGELLGEELDRVGLVRLDDLVALGLRGSVTGTLPAGVKNMKTSSDSGSRPESVSPPLTALYRNRSSRASALSMHSAWLITDVTIEVCEAHGRSRRPPEEAERPRREARERELFARCKKILA